MRLRRWDIVFVRAHEKDEVGHPGVVLSHEDMLADPGQHRLNVLIGSKKQPAQGIGPHQVALNGADGLEFMTLVDCALIYMVNKTNLLRHAGTVSWFRRQEIQRKVRAYLGLG